MSSPRGARAPLFVGLVVVAFALAALPALPALPLVRASQARAWSVARTMVTSGDWVLPRYQGETRLKKPPLQSWAQAATMEAAGSTDLRWAGAASWLVGVLFALGPLALGAALGRPIAGLLGSLLLATTRASMLWGTSPEHDVPFAGFVAFSLAALARALGPSGRPWHAWAAGLLGGAAVLVKGPFALAFVGGTALVAARGRREAPLSGPALVLPLIVGLLAPAGLWLLAVLGRLGALDAVADEILRQASGSEGAHVRRGVGYVVYYLGMIPKWSMPWTAFLAVALFALWRGRGEARRGSEGPSLRFGVLAFAVIALVLTAAPAKQEHYLLSALPPAFLLVGGVLEAIAARLGPRAWILPALLALGGAALAASRVVPAARLDPHVPLFVDLGFLGVVVLVALGLGRRLEGTRGLVAGLLLAALAVGLGARRSSLFDRADGDLREDARALHAAWPPGPSLVGFAPGRGEAFDVLVAWIPRPYERVRTAQELAARLDRGDAPLVLVREPQLGALGPTAARLRAVRVVAPPHGADAKDRVQVFVPK